jgi:hypothetical protein
VDVESGGSSNEDQSLYGVTGDQHQDIVQISTEQNAQISGMHENCISTSELAPNGRGINRFWWRVYLRESKQTDPAFVMLNLSRSRD